MAPISLELSRRGIHPGTSDLLLTKGPATISTVGDFTELQTAEGDFWHMMFPGIGVEGKGKVEEAVAEFVMAWSQLHPDPREVARKAAEAEAEDVADEGGEDDGDN